MPRTPTNAIVIDTRHPQAKPGTCRLVIRAGDMVFVRVAELDDHTPVDYDDVGGARKAAGNVARRVRLPIVTEPQPKG